MLSSPAAETCAIERARPLLGTRVAIRVKAHGRAHEAIDAAFAAVTRVHVAMSFQEATSDVSAINRAQPCTHVVLDQTTLECLRRARLLFDVSDGLFDPCLGGVFDDLILVDDGAVIRRRLRIDLSGIAKGFAVDAACDALHAHGVYSAVVDAGGDLRVLGGNEEPVALRPRRGPPAVIALADGAVASSDAWGAIDDEAAYGRGTVHRRPNGDRVRTGFVAVAAPDCTMADALTKVVLADSHRAGRVLAGFGAVAHLSDGKQWTHLP